MAPGPHKLYWKSQLVGVITEVTFSDFPWKAGRFEARRVSSLVREVLNWFAAQADADDLQDPPFTSDRVEGWVVVNPDGGRHELLLPPLVEFDKSIATWR